MADKVDKPKKRGTQSSFQGQRGEFLENWIGAYVEASRKKTTAKMWDRLFPQYWANFPWRSPLTQELVGPIFLNTDENWVAHAMPNETLTSDEEAKKMQVVKDTQKKIKSWFNHRRTSVGLAANPWVPFLKQLRQPGLAPPKRVPDFQFYMAHDDFKDKVAAVYNKKHAGTPKKQQLAVKCQIARDLLATEPKEVRERLVQEMQEAHEEELEAHASALEGLPSLDEGDRALARERFSAIVTLLLLALSEYTGYKLTLLAGRVVTEPEIDVQVVGLNAGTLKGENGKMFPAWDASVYKSTLQGFSRFIWAAHQSESDVPSSAVSPPPAPNPDDDIILPDAREQTSPSVAPTTLMMSTAADSRAANDDMDNDHSAANSLPADDDMADDPMDIDRPARDPFEGLIVNPALRRKTIAESKNSEDLKLAIWRLGRLSESELVRANNIAHNKELLTNLGLNKTFEEAMGLPTTRATRKSGQKSGGKGGRGRKAKRARVEGERTSSDEEEEEDEEEDEEEESGDEEVQEPPATREKRAKPTPKAAAPKEWAKKAKALLEEGDSGLLWSAGAVNTFQKSMAVSVTGLCKAPC
ncbi:hypothetical protein B0H14DRAFT_3756640 [Mycena olivaceomarginata]|nr:hypothetical protein B0H14DRAFT_3756640 [Mycena olivaceomarginata]